MNLVELDGSYVCTYCGIVQDIPCFEYVLEFRNEENQTTNSLLNEFCHRLAIDSVTQFDSESLYNRSITKNPYVQKLILLSCSLYIACKKNKCPRTMKEICAVSGVDVKQIGQYEHLVCNQYYPTKASDYVNRFGGKLELKYNQIQRINQEIEKVTTNIYNPIALCAAAIYKTMTPSVIDLNQLEDITGIPSSSIKKISKKI